MERAVAIKALTKLLGKSVGYRVDPKAPTKDERDAAREALTHAVTARTVLSEKKQARADALLAGDSEYQALKSEYEAARDMAETLQGTTLGYRFTVGRVQHGFFLVRAQGDSWEEVIAKLTENKAAAA